MFLDEAMQAMKDPIVVEVDAENLAEMTAEMKDSDETLQLYGKVVFIGGTVEDGECKFVDITLNRVFVSVFSNPQMAYNDYLKNSRHAKRVKLAMSMKKAEDDNTLMMRAMRVAVIAVSERLLTGKKHQKTKNTLPDKTLLIKDVIPTYFHIGASVNLLVNNPINMFDMCIKNQAEEIKDIVYGRKRLGDSDTLMLVQAKQYLSTKGNV